ncbi:DNA-binding transcriptional regulator, ArsR family [Pelagibacterium luteolum]|jgi:DNA-binding transcriptional ArsR family regulator|uniref:DNA-binding transcriptional regulator, ArsR family n=2 Tax=Pelagibacterium luteolum TaxID=440168 RepID=A0A1G7XBA6_9HYPH|nr:DNA-binding transcriptional regulator, ArsR family [Pelagibacterium luteolum]
MASGISRSRLMRSKALHGETMSVTELSKETIAIKEKADDASAFLKKLANRDRLLICCALVDGERSVRELEDSLDLRQPGLSQQLAELRSADLIVGRKEGKQVFYSLADTRVERFISTMYELFCA